MTTIIKYRLSNTQNTGLLVRAELLRIALPIPGDFPPDPSDSDLRSFVLNSLPDVEAAHVRTVYETELAIAPYQSAARKPPQMHPILADATTGTFHMLVQVVVAELSKSPKPRHTTNKIQWPGDISRAIAKQPAAAEDDDAEFYVTRNGERIALGELAPAARTLYEDLQLHAKTLDWNSFENYWTDAVRTLLSPIIASPVEQRKTAIYRIAKDMCSRIAIKEGAAT